MSRLIRKVAKFIGIHFTPDNHVTPIFRLGRYHRVQGPGIFWAFPLLQQVSQPVKTSIQVGNFTYKAVLSKDNIPFEINLTILFSFSPEGVLKDTAAQLIKGGDDLWRIIVDDYANQGLRRLVARFPAEELGGKAVMSALERDLANFLKAVMRPLGLAPLKHDGVLIKETLAPETFAQTMLETRRLEAALNRLGRYDPDASGIHQAIQPDVVDNIEALDQEFTLWSALAPLENIPSFQLDLSSLALQEAAPS